MTAVTLGALETANVVGTTDVTTLVNVSVATDNVVVVVESRLLQLTVKGTGTLVAVLAL